MRIACVTILFNPSTEEVVKNISSYIDFVNELYIVDNSLNENSIIKEKLTQPNVFYLHDGENKGLATRLNTISQTVYNKGFEWILTMDQDSFFDKADIFNYFKIIENYENRNITAMFGVNYIKSLVKKDSIEECAYLITSGSILNLSLFKKIGFFDENLFIDWVDSEYCYRSLLNGFKLIKCYGIYLNHNLGDIKMGRSFKSGKLTPRTLHNPLRMYYLVRNYFYILQKLPQLSPAVKKEMRKNLLIRIKNNLLYNKRLAVIKYIVKGYFDFRNNKMGKLTN